MKQVIGWILIIVGAVGMFRVITISGRIRAFLDRHDPRSVFERDETHDRIVSQIPGWFPLVFGSIASVILGLYLVGFFQ